MKASRKELKWDTRLGNFDFSLLFVTLFLFVIGFIMIYSTSSYSAEIKFGNAAHYALKQGAFGLLGIVFLLVIAFWIPYGWFPVLGNAGYILATGLCYAILIPGVGVKGGGQVRWVEIAGVRFQPSELAKIGMILLLSYYLTVNRKKMRQPKVFWIYVLLALVPVVPVIATNLSTGIVMLLIAAAMLFVAHFDRKRMLWCIGLALAGTVLCVGLYRYGTTLGILKAYQLQRIDVWLDPEAYASEGGYQVLQGLYALCTGGFFGKGLGNSIQKLGFIPEAQNDMIFAVLCEELGLFGGLSVCFLYAFMLRRLCRIACRAVTLYEGLLVTGITAHLALQVLLHIAVVSGAMPNTGITLPFISYGGTSVFIMLCEIGLALNVSRRSGGVLEA